MSVISGSQLDKEAINWLSQMSKGNLNHVNIGVVLHKMVEINRDALRNELSIIDEKREAIARMLNKS